MKKYYTLCDQPTFASGCVPRYCTITAAELDTTQPTLSRTIQQLEEITGARLVERTTREFWLTSDGISLAEEARDVLARLEDRLSSIGMKQQPPLRLGWAWAGFGKHTVPLLQAWKKVHAYPVELSRPADPMNALRHEHIDAALVRHSPPNPSELDGYIQSPLFTESLVAAIAADDPRSSLETVSLAQLAQTPLAVCRTAPTATAALWSDPQESPRTFTVSGTDEWLTHIALGEAVGITAEATIHNHQTSDVSYLPISDAPAVEVSLVYPRKQPHPQAEVFASFGRDYLAQTLMDHTPPYFLGGIRD